MAPSILTNLGCAGGAAVITVTFIHPIDTVKTRLQVSGTGNARNYAELGLAGTCSTIAKEEGWSALFSGLGPRVGWITIGGFVFFGAYEKAQEMLWKTGTWGAKPEKKFTV